VERDVGTEPPQPQSDQPGRRRIVKRTIKTLIAISVVIGLAFAVRSAIDRWQHERESLRGEIAELDQALQRTADPAAVSQLKQQRARLQASVPRLNNLRWRWIGLASLLYAAALFPPGMLLHRALRALGENPRFSTAVAAQLIGHLGKYVPGKAMVIVLRSGALAQDGVRLVPATISVFMETFLMMAVGAAVAGLVIGWLPVPGWMTVMAILAAILASLPTLPPVLTRVAARVTGSKTAVGSMQAVGVFIAGWVYSLLGWVLIGGSFTALIYAIPTASELPGPAYLYAIATAAISLAMVAGFASLIPGGAGVRELVLATILGVSLGSAHGLLAAIAARLVFIAVEATLGFLAWLWLRRQRGRVVG
jgi:uncharacterized membrane protein YbhN (UPF0104 family)